MKVLQVLVLIISLCVFVNAQACFRHSELSIHLTDSSGQSIRKAKFQFFDTKFKNKKTEDYYSPSLPWSEESQLYLFDMGFDHGDVGIKVSAEGFEDFKKVISLKQSYQGYSVKLKRTRTSEVPEITKLNPISGVISDLEKKAIANAKILVFEDNNLVFEDNKEKVTTVSNLYGYYQIYLKKGTYRVEVMAKGFKTTSKRINVLESKYVDFNLRIDNRVSLWSKDVDPSKELVSKWNLIKDYINIWSFWNN